MSFYDDFSLWKIRIDASVTYPTLTLETLSLPDKLEKKFGAIMKLVFLPGIDGTGILFEPILKKLQNWETLIVKIPEAGNQNYLDLTITVRDLLPKDENFILIAESFSGPIAARISKNPPKNLNAIIYVSTFLSTPNFLYLTLGKYLPLKKLLTVPFSDFFIKFLLLGKTADQKLLELFKNAISNTSEITIKKRLDSISNLNVRTIDRRKLSLHICATKDKFITHKAKQEFEQKYKCQKVNVEGPHFLLQSKPDECAKIIKTFISDNIRGQGKHPLKSFFGIKEKINENFISMIEQSIKEKLDLKDSVFHGKYWEYSNKDNYLKIYFNEYQYFSKKINSPDKKFMSSTFSEYCTLIDLEGDIQWYNDTLKKINHVRSLTLLHDVKYIYKDKGRVRTPNENAYYSLLHSSRFLKKPDFKFLPPDEAFDFPGWRNYLTKEKLLKTMELFEKEAQGYDVIPEFWGNMRIAAHKIEEFEKAEQYKLKFEETK